MHAGKTLAVFLLTGIALTAAAQQSTQYVITEYPPAPVGSEQAITVKWAGRADPLHPPFPDSAVIYYSLSPGGSNPANYPDSVTKFKEYISEDKRDTIRQTNVEINGSPAQRGTVFYPRDQRNMSGGVYYVIAANKAKGYVSNEVKVIVEVPKATQAKSPAMEAQITSLTPTFEWYKNPGVPYYHVIVSDEKMGANFDERTFEGLSIIWQAITSNTQITYGAPDPSGTLTADPPPLSPAAGYSWVVLNNYGNHPAYTSKRFGFPRNFTIAGTPMIQPVNQSPVEGETLWVNTSPHISFKWKNLDPKANTYKIYVYVGAEFAGVDAGIVEWSTEVTAGQFAGADVAEVEVDARSIFTSNYYTWKVIAVDANGAGSASKETGFRYAGVPTGVLRLYTREIISDGAAEIRQIVAGAKMELQMLDAPLESPPLFYTDDKGKLFRARPAGTYRITARKDGFLPAAKTISLGDKDTVTDTFFMERPAATIYGKVVNADGKAIDLADVIAVSDLGDTATDQSDVLGNFVIGCSQANWRVWAQKSGYAPSLPQKVSVITGQSAGIGRITLRKFSYTLSGTVKNESGTPVIGAKVQLYTGDVLLGEVPSTPQDGGYSFGVEGGSYKLVATKTGFTSATVALDVLSSVQRTLTLTSGAALVKGVIYGERWGSGGKIYAPITNATVLFIDTAAAPDDTLSTLSDNVFGDFAISVASNKTYIMCSRADGYGEKTSAAPIATEAGKTYIVTDTLQAMAYISGTVTASESGDPVRDVTVSLVDAATWEAVAQARTDAAGKFEIRNIPDGNWKIKGGKEQYMFDAVTLVDTAGTLITDSAVEVSEGRAVRLTPSGQKIIRSVNIQVQQGTKTVAWTLLHQSGKVTDALIKVRSPLLATVGTGDSLTLVGPNHYVVSVDADADTLVDVSRRVVAVEEGSPAVLADTIELPIVHRKASDTMSLANGALTMELKVYGPALDTALVFYKDEGAPAFDSTGYAAVSVNAGVRLYTFTFSPHTNGSNLVYYFRAQRGEIIYGYPQETYTVFIRPDITMLTKMEIVPSASDTALLPAEAQVTFALYGYYGSKFLPDTTIQGDWITWRLINSAGCGLNAQRLQSTRGLKVDVYTPSSGTAGAVVTLVAKIDTRYKSLIPGMSDSITAYFIGSASRLDSIRVRRLDPDGRSHITTAPAEKAEFIADGYDGNGAVVTITPRWSISPEDAGAISERGIFKPASRFSGYVRVMANVGNRYAEFNPQTGKHINESGLAVHYMIPQVSDSVFNGRGCAVVLPAHMIDTAHEGELMIATPQLTNRNERVSGDYSIVGDAFEIYEVNKAPLTLGRNDSIRLVLSVPDGYEGEAAAGSSEFFAAYWNEDSLRWEALANSQIRSDGRVVTANITHFSRYAILYKAGGGGVAWSIKPNPFSPYIRPIGDWGYDAPKGTCIAITIKQYSSKFKLEIYNVVGDRVLHTRYLNPYTNDTYYLWWDGRGKTIGEADVRSINPDKNWFEVAGDKMCRNGRYFAVLTVTDIKNKEERFMKPVVLFK